MQLIKPIKNEQDYEVALRTVEPMFDNEPPADTPEGDFFEIMCVLIKEYENKHYLIDAPDPVEAIKFRMEQQGLTVKDLEPAIGKANRVYEILNRKRKLTLPMIRKLHTQFGIPLRSLLGV
ncbi:TPA: type II toxin-antitoxin system HigA family antitoxin [Salmonella enterica subsp. enterica serovar Paratyphi B]|nr:transcriptional regulator [Salmonella enterica]EDR7001716.1 transcriptional regulator [Salmonella enterica subsp. enterica serovar Java]EJC3483656.1 transcriptional regulator [Salmonella enterica]